MTRAVYRRRFLLRHLWLLAMRIAAQGRTIDTELALLGAAITIGQWQGAGGKTS